MKKFTLFAIAALISVVAFAQKPNQFLKSKPIPFEQTQLKVKAVSRQATVRKAPRRSLGLVTPPESAVAETYYTASGTLLVNSSSGWQNGTPESVQVIVDGTDIYIAGLAYYVDDAWIKGTIDGTTATFPAAQQVDDDETYPEWISASDDGQTICDVVFNFDQEAGVLECTNTYIGECAKEDAFSIYAYWTQPTFTKEQPEGPELVVLPAGLEAKEYVMTYDEGSTPVNVAVDGNDVYFQGMSNYIPEAWVKGTKEGNTVTFAAMQYVGEYANYTSFFFYNGEAVFTYNAEADTYSAEGLVFGVLGDQYYDGKYTNPVISPVVEKATTPANPEITGLEESNYGYYVEFNVPLLDVNGEPLVSSKLSFIIYTDTEGEIAPLTFTPATHTKLTQSMTEIPYGFTENYDFYSTYIYLNDLYSSDWNNLGIKSIYRGGGEENETEIQWFHIKDYAGSTGDFTFDFNKMSVPTSTNTSTAGDIKEDFVVTEGTVTLTVSPQDEGASYPNRFWSVTIDGASCPQLRMYSGTMTFEVPEGFNMTNIAFNYNSTNWGGKNNGGDVKADSGTLTDDPENKVATWAGEAQKVVISVGANTQLNSIVVTVVGGEVDDKLVVLPEGVEAEEWALEGFYGEDGGGNDVFRATEVAFDGNDVYVKGLAFWFEDAWLKGTLDTETNFVTFPKGQFVGSDEYGKEYMVGYYNGEICDIEYAFNSEEKTLIQVTPYVLESSTETGLDEEGKLAFWGYWEVSFFHAGEPTTVEAAEAPEGLETETYTFKANEWVEVEEEEGNDEGDGARRMKAPRKEMESQPYSYQMEVGFDGNDVYFKGVSDDTADMWLKGTLSQDGKTVTIPALQYMGFISAWISTYDYYLTAVNDEDEGFEDIVLNYDAETNTFSTDQTIMLNGSMFVYYPYQIFTNVEITKMEEFAATPADPSIEEYKLEGAKYPYISFNIPAKDVDGNDIISAKLFYTVWIQEDGLDKPFEVLADEYEYVEEDMTEIPYTWDDSYDIYRGGTRFYINPANVIGNWTKFGIQSIYYGGGERNTSNIVWMENPVYTAITDVNFNNEKAVIFDMQGRRVANPVKGLYIVNGKKAVLK